MNDGIGSATTLTIIVAFVAVVSSYMAFNVNYTKAFRMKNKIVDNYNKYGISCRSTSSECYRQIVAYANELGYKPRKVLCPAPDKNSLVDPSSNDYYCAIPHPKEKDEDAVSDANYVYYSITTTIDIDIPIVRNVFGLRLLTITGDTKTFAVRSEESNYFKDSTSSEEETVATGD